jgi:hypothetical protein
MFVSFLCTAKIRPDGKDFLATGFFVDRSGIFVSWALYHDEGRKVNEIVEITGFRTVTSRFTRAKRLLPAPLPSPMRQAPRDAYAATCDAVVRTDIFTQSHKGTKKGILKIFKILFVISLRSAYFWLWLRGRTGFLRDHHLSL